MSITFNCCRSLFILRIQHLLNVVFWTCCEKAWTKYIKHSYFSDFIKLSDTREKKGKRHECRYKYITAPGIAQYPSHTLSRSRALAHSRKGPELQRAARQRAIQHVRVSRAAWHLVAELHGIFERTCIGSRRGWMASWRGARRETGAAAAATGGCTVRASTVAEIEDSQCVRRWRRRRRQGGTLAACVADTVGGGCVVVRWAQAHASGGDGETGARMLTGPGDPMEESVWAPGNANAAAAHALGVAGRTIGAQRA
ncbi:hypothetical protein B0H13DRAFT_1888609 [Mycena leptocephala]|nr:hypothetical protein B0H13DRAFT_1888609 [Mycena leptocephala]